MAIQCSNDDSGDLNLSTDQSVLLEQGHWFALNGDLKRSFQAYSRAFRKGPLKKEILCQLVSALITTTQRNIRRGNVNTDSPQTEELFDCGICEALLEEPVTLSCGHTFCKGCLEYCQFFKNSLCCWNALTEDDVKVNVLLTAVLKTIHPEVVVKRAEIKLEGKKRLFQGQVHKAKECFSAVLESAPHDTNTLCWRCDAYMKLELYDLALRDADLVCRLHPEMAKAFERKAEALMKLHKTGEAVVAFLRCLSLDPQNEVYREKTLAALYQLFSPPEYSNTFSFRKSAILTSSEKNTFLESGLVVSEDHVIGEGSGLQQATTNLSSNKDTRKQGVSDANLTPQKRQTTELKNKNQRQASERSIEIEDFECNLCYSLLFRPVTTLCGHSFCRDCLDRSLDHRVGCPCCRTALTTHLIDRKRNVTLLLEKVLKKHFPVEYAEREKQYLKEMERLKRVGEDEDVEVPIFVCTMAFPTVQCPLHIFEPKYRLMIRRCIESGACQFGMCVSSDDPEKQFEDYGTMLHIRATDTLPDGRSIIQTVGGRRFHVLSRGMTDGYYTARVEWIKDEEEKDCEEAYNLAQLNSKCYALLCMWFNGLTSEQQGCILNALGQIPPCVSDLQALPNGPSWVWWTLAALPLQDNVRLIILRMTSLEERLTSIQRFLHVIINMETTK